MNQYVTPFLVVVVVVSAILSGSAFITSRQSDTRIRDLQNRFTTLEAKVTPVTPATPSSPSSPTQTPASQTPTTDGTPDVSTWNAYENKQLGFRFKYPKEWDMKALMRDIDKNATLALAFGTAKCQDCDQPPAMQVRVWSSVYSFDANSLNLKVKDLADLVAKYAANSEPVYQNVKPVKVAGLSGYQADAGPDVFGGGRFVLLPMVGGKLIELWFFEPDGNGKRSSTNILPTFEF